MHPLDWASLVTVLAATVTGVFLLLRRGSAMSSRTLAVVMLAGAAWAALGLVVTHTTDPATVVTANRVLVVVASVQTASAVWFCWTLAGHRLRSRLARVLAVEPLLLVVMVLTDPWTGAVVTDVRLQGTVSVDFGWFFWVHTVYCYALLATGAAALLRAAGRAVPGHRLHYLLAVAAMAPPSLGNVVSVLGAGGGQRDLTAPLFVVTALLWLWVDRLSVRFRSAPITTAQVLRALTDGVMVIDAAGHLVDANPAGRRLMLRRDHTDSPAEAVGPVGAHWRDVGAADLVQAVTDGTTGTVRRADGSVVDLRITPVVSRGRGTGWVVVARDVTEVERLRCELAEQAVRDGLTGLHNRRHLERVLTAAVADTAIHTAPLSVAVVDIDHFKVVNDRHGHPVGDRVLVAVAEAMVAGVREGDVVARLGGEEFVLVLPGLGAEQAAQRVEAVRRSCAGIRTDVREAPGTTTVGVTVSAGVAQHRAGQDVHALLAAADAALYAAKAGGRDRVVVGGAVPSPR